MAKNIKCECGIDCVLLDGQMVTDFLVEVKSLDNAEKIALMEGKKVIYDPVKHYNHRRRRCIAKIPLVNHPENYKKNIKGNAVTIVKAKKREKEELGVFELAEEVNL